MSEAAALSAARWTATMPCTPVAPLKYTPRNNIVRKISENDPEKYSKKYSTTRLTSYSTKAVLCIKTSESFEVSGDLYMYVYTYHRPLTSAKYSIKSKKARVLTRPVSSQIPRLNRAKTSCDQSRTGPESAHAKTKHVWYWVVWKTLKHGTEFAWWTADQPKRLTRFRNFSIIFEMLHSTDPTTSPALWLHCNTPNPLTRKYCDYWVLFCVGILNWSHKTQ